MDPIAILQNRIEQLEAKLGLASDIVNEGQQGDSATANLMNAAQSINNAIAGHERLSKIHDMANELNNYTDPNLIENMQQNNMKMQEIAAAEPIIKHHCHCMHKCGQGAPVLESEPLQQVPQMQETVNQMHVAAAEVKTEADVKVEQLEEKKFPRRRNGLD
ncbi:unnamed protein product [Leptidea sinapis]|uniref:Uncharacterized protein n=2 Tax=Leptidea sinapis TaxID=189913 RepID=A0A5E4Q088_9NEOP|nr:unnamed protein product [Leptidea sinapis]